MRIIESRLRNSNRGASIVIALVLLLVCTTVSVVIVTSASVNAERIHKEMKERQAYNSVSSAIQATREVLLTRQINDLVVWVSGTGTKTFAFRDFDGEDWSDGGREWAKWVCEATESIANGAREVGPYTETVDSGDSRLPKVRVSFIMGSDYTIKIKAQLDESELSVDSSSDLLYAMSTEIRQAGPAAGAGGEYGYYWADGTPTLKEPEAPETPKPNDPPPEAMFYQSTVWGDSSHRDEWFRKHWRASGFVDSKISGLYPYAWKASNKYVVCLQYDGKWFIPQSYFDGHYGLSGWMDCGVVVEDWSTLIDPSTNRPKDGYYRHVVRRAQVWGAPMEHAPNATSWPVRWIEVTL